MLAMQRASYTSCWPVTHPSLDVLHESFMCLMNVIVDVDVPEDRHGVTLRLARQGQGPHRAVFDGATFQFGRETRTRSTDRF